MLNYDNRWKGETETSPRHKMDWKYWVLLTCFLGMLVLVVRLALS